MRTSPTPEPSDVGEAAAAQPPDLSGLADWVVPIMAAVITGILATWLTSWLQRRNEDRASRRAGIGALRNMQRCLYDLALVYEDHETHEGVHFSGTTRLDLGLARSRAYEHISVLKPADRHLVKRAELNGREPMDDSEQLWAWAKDLETAIDAVDPHARGRGSAKKAE